MDCACEWRLCSLEVLLRIHHVLLALVGGCGGGSSSAPDASAGMSPGPVLTASPGSSVAHLSWTPVDGATAYNVYRSDTLGAQGTEVTSAPATAVDDTTVTNFTPYWYEVTGVVDGVETAPSNQVSAFGYDLAHWTARRSGIPLASMSYVPASESGIGHDTYVIGAFWDGLVLASQDGLTWQGSASVATVNSIAYGDGKFVGVGDGFLTSPDGLTWTVAQTSVQDIHSVAYVQYGAMTSPSRLFIAAGTTASNTSGIYTSPDGMTWTQQSCPGLGIQPALDTVSTLTSFNVHTHVTSFVAVVGGQSGDVCASTDGTTWTKLSVDATGTAWFANSVADPQTTSVWLADEYGTIYQLPYNFSTAAFGAFASTTLPSGSGTFSFSGITTYSDAAATRHVTVLRSDGTLYDTAGNSPASGFTAITPVLDTPLVAPPLVAYGLASAGSELYVVGGSEQILRSSDGGGSFSVLHDDPGGDPYENRSVVVRGSEIVVDRGSGAVWTSSDGVTFTAATLGTALPSTTVVDTGSGFGLVYVDPASALELYESADAQTWTHTTIPVTACPACAVNQQYSGDGISGGVVTASGGGYLVSLDEAETGVQETVGVTGSVATGFTSALQTPTETFLALWSDGSVDYGLTYNSILTSSDGFSWTIATMLPTSVQSALGSEQAGPHAYVDDGAIRYLALAAGKISTSPDGVTWSDPVQIDPARRSVNGFIRLGDHLIAYGDGGLLTATADGATWTPIDAGTSGNYRDAAVTDHGLVLSGAYDVVVTAP